jgi:hypothetical protein
MKTNLSFLSPKGYFTARSAFILFIVLALSSCATEEVVDPVTVVEDEANAISFGTFLDRTPIAPAASPSGIKPLATVLDKIGLQNGDGFTVLAYTTQLVDWTSFTPPATPDFMSSQTVTWNSTVWEYDPIKYWPKAGDAWGKVTFFGYSTVDGATATGVASSNPKIAFTTNAAAASQVDLVADADFNVTKETAGGKVKFNFDHILSKIGFTAKLAESYSPATVTITSLRVYYTANKVNSSGTYTFSNTDNKADVNWALGTTYFANQPTIGTGDPIFSDIQELSTSSENLSGTANYLMLIPQTPAVSDMYVELAYNVAYSDGSTVNNLSKINLPAISGGWKSGMAYTYNFTLTLNPVVFDTLIDVNDWTNAPPADIPGE